MTRNRTNRPRLITPTKMLEGIRGSFLSVSVFLETALLFDLEVDFVIFFLAPEAAFWA